MSNPLVIVANGRVISGIAVTLSKAQLKAARLLAHLDDEALGGLMQFVRVEADVKRDQNRRRMSATVQSSVASDVLLTDTANDVTVRPAVKGWDRL